MDNTRDRTLAKMRQGAFRANTGRVLRAINILRSKYVKLHDCMYALDDMAESDFSDCVNYLYRAGYIDLRTVVGHHAANTADFDLADLEAAVSAQGIRLLGGEITDAMVDM